jgi:DHA1 family bicyclomycin/chloramphenicol resistance-like MFS transporter
MGRNATAFTLSLLLGLQPVTTDVYLPALPMLTKTLGASLANVQLTMSALILSFGLAQMAWGPAADRFGRRPVLLAGLALYIAASVGCLLANDIHALVLWRVLQGAALAAAVVCARAIVRDLYDPAQGAQVMAAALGGLGLIALVGPLLGGLAAQTFGWRGPLAVVALAGSLCLLYVGLRVPETLRQRGAGATNGHQLFRVWLDIGHNRIFRAWALLVACSYGGLFTVLAASSFVFMDVLGLSATSYGGTMAFGSVCYMAGTLACRRWIARHGIAVTVRRAGWFSLAAALTMAVPAAIGVQSVLTVLLPYGLFAFAHGQHQPCGQAGVVGPFPRAAGAASALAGLLLALVAFVVGHWLGGALDGSVRPLAFGMAFWSLLTCAVAWTLVPRALR